MERITRKVLMFFYDDKETSPTSFGYIPLDLTIRMQIQHIFRLSTGHEIVMKKFLVCEC